MYVYRKKPSYAKQTNKNPKSNNNNKNPDFKMNSILKKIFEKIIRAIARGTS